MKFDRHRFWRHTRAMDIFFSVNSVAFDDNGKDAILHGTWCTQGQTKWFYMISARIKVTPSEYDNWNPYTPVGSLTL